MGIFLLALCSSFVLSGCGDGKKSYEKGIRLAQEGNYTEAAQYLEAAIKENKEKAEYYIGYGMILNGMGEYQQAIEQFELAYQDTDNRIANANNKQLFYGEALAYFNLNQYDKSQEYCKKALEFKEPGSMDADILCSQGAVYEVLGEQEKAKEMYQQAIKKDKENWSAYLKKASLEEKLKEWEEAKKDYQLVIKASGQEKYEAYFRLYELCQSQGEEDTSEQILKEITQTKSKDPFVLCQIGRAYQYQGDEEKATEYFQKSLENGYAESEYYLGMNAMSKKDYDGAESYFKAYLKSKGQFRALAYNQLAGCSIEKGDYAKASEYLDAGLQISDSADRALLWQNQILVYERERFFQKAKKSAKEYLSVYPQDEKMKKELEFIKTRTKQKKRKQENLQ
ncbi:MAG: tetratricopeptide repeat protein [Lachnospiraceae bacterium]|nr:tetratricopeptide repeat protein [Lachnospiraceae bacterium]